MRKLIPQETQRAVWERCGGRCESCGEPRPLDLHCKTYQREVIGPNDCRALCRDCHLAEHLDFDNELREDPDELRWILE